MSFVITIGVVWSPPSGASVEIVKIVENFDDPSPRSCGPLMSLPWIVLGVMVKTMPCPGATTVGLVMVGLNVW